MDQPNNPISLGAKGDSLAVAPEDLEKVRAQTDIPPGQTQVQLPEVTVTPENQAGQGPSPAAPPAAPEAATALGPGAPIPEPKEEETPVSEAPREPGAAEQLLSSFNPISTAHAEAGQPFKLWSHDIADHEAATRATVLSQPSMQQPAEVPNFKPDMAAGYASQETMGDPRDPGWQQQNLTTIQAPSGAQFTVHKDAAPYFQGFLKDLEATGYQTVSGGGFNIRDIAGGQTPSQHSWGAAIDVNPEANPVDQAKLITNLPPNIRDIADKWNLTWGGDWQSKKDPMHFQWNGPEAYAAGWGHDWGMMHNNPGNLRVPGVQLPTAQGGFQAFPTMRDGIKAIGQNLDAYAAGTTLSGQPLGHPVNTIQDIVHTWAPPNENDTEPMIARAVAIMHTRADTPLDMSDPNVKLGMIRAILQNEHGGIQPVTNTQIQQALSATPNMSASRKAPTPTVPGMFQLPDYSTAATPAGAVPGSSRNPYIDQQFRAAHSADLNPLREFGYHFGMDGLGVLAQLAGLPGNVEHLPAYLTGGQTSYKPYSWSSVLKGELPTSSQISRRLGEAVNYDFERPPPTNAIGHLGAVAGETVAGSLPFTAAGLVAGALKVPVGAGKMGNALASARQGPLGYALKEGLEFPTLAGLGAGEVGNIYHEMGGGDQGEGIAEIIGGLLASARIPVGTGAISLAQNIARRGGEGLGILRSPLDKIQGMTTADAKMAMASAIRDQLEDSLDRAKLEVTNLVPTHPETAGLSDTALTQQIADTFHAHVVETLNDAEMLRRSLWSPQAGVNMDMGRDVGRTIKLRDQLENDANFQIENKNLDPASFPRQTLDKIFEGKWERSGLTDAQGNPIAVQGGLKSAAVSLKTALNTRDRIEDAIRGLQAQSDPNQLAIGTLKKLSRSLLSDIVGNGITGMTPAESNAFNKARAFDQTLSDIRDQPQIDNLLSSARDSAGRIFNVSLLDKWVREGNKGADAANLLNSLSGLRAQTTGAGSVNDLHTVIGDAIRQKFAEQVAPNGYVDMQAWARFMSPAKYGSFLARPEYGDLAHQLSQAAMGEHGAMTALSLGKDRLSPMGGGLSGEIARNASTQLWLDNPVDQVMTHIAKSPNQEASVKGVFKELDRDSTGHAADGFIRMLGDQAAQTGAQGLQEWAEKNPGIVKALSARDPEFQHRLDDLTNVKTKAGITAQLTDLALRWAGARVGGMTSRETGSSFVMAAAGSRFARQVFASMTPSTSREMFGLILTNNDAYNAFVGAAGGSMKDLHLLHAYIPGLPLGVAEGPDMEQRQ